MSSMPFVSDVWQYRSNRLFSSAGDSEDLATVARNLWKTFKDGQKSVNIPSMRSDDVLDVDVYYFQQGPTRPQAYFDLTINTDTFLHKYRLLASHASLRSALAESSTDKIIGVANVNLRDLSPRQIHGLCHELVEWWDYEQHIYASPFTQIADILRNWLRGVYSGVPQGIHPSLVALDDKAPDRRDLIVESALSIVDYLQKSGRLPSSYRAAILGRGLWSESVCVQLEMSGTHCSTYDIFSSSCDADVLFLMSPTNIITRERAEFIKGKVLVELLPEQVNPDADSVLVENGNFVIPDLVAQSSEEIVEEWLIGGRKVPKWQTAVRLQLHRVLEALDGQLEKGVPSAHDAALVIAMENLAHRLPFQD